MSERIIGCTEKLTWQSNRLPKEYLGWTTLNFSLKVRFESTKAQQASYNTSGADLFAYEELLLTFYAHFQLNRLTGVDSLWYNYVGIPQTSKIEKTKQTQIVLLYQ